jgi:hypothetical protein
MTEQDPGSKGYEKIVTYYEFGTFRLKRKQ